MNTTSYPTDLTDEQWSLLEPMMPPPGVGGRPQSVPRRTIINAILYLQRAGCAWRLLPREFGNWSTIYYYFRLWRIDGTWELIHKKLREKVRRKIGKKPTPTAAILDSQSVKTAAPQKGGRMATTRVRRLPAENATFALIPWA